MLPASRKNALQGKRSQEGQKKRFKYTQKVTMKSFDIMPNWMEYMTLDRHKWREGVKRGEKVCETRRNVTTELRRKLRKYTVTSATAATISCSHHTKLFRAQIGLISQLCILGCFRQS